MVLLMVNLRTRSPLLLHLPTPWLMLCQASWSVPTRALKSSRMMSFSD